MTHLAFDLGLRTTGIAWPDGSDHFICPPKLRSTPRLEWWRDTLRVALLPHPGVDIVVEAPFIHPKHITGAVELIKLHGLLTCVAIDNRSDIHTVTPAELKRWAAGNGNAPKDDMLTAARQRGWEGVNHDEADAYLLWCYWGDGGGGMAA